MNDTLAEMEAFMAQGAEYSENDLSNFHPKSKNENRNHLQVPAVTDMFYNEENSNILKTVLNQNAMKYNNLKTSLENLCFSEKKTPIKCTYRSENDLLSPEILFTPTNLHEKNKSLKVFTPKNKENIKPNVKKSNEIFKTPLPKTNYNNIVSPISRYISQSPTVPLLKKIVSKTVPFSEHEFKNKEKPIKIYKPLPQIDYKPSKIQQVTMTERESPLPKNLNKYISGPLRPEIIRHKRRVNVKKEFEDYHETYAFDAKVEDLSETIDFETSRFIEMSVLVNSEAKFSWELQ